MVYLARKNGAVVHHTSKEAMAALDGVEPEKTITDAEFEAAEGLVRIINNNIFVGKTDAEKAEDKQAEIQEWKEEKILAVEASIAALQTAINNEADSRKMTVTGEAIIRQGQVTAIEETALELGNNINEIKELIPNQASPSNKLTDANFVNSSISNMAANYVTPNAAGDSQFASLNALRAGPWYHGGAPYSPSQNDYAIFINTDNSTWRAAFNGQLWSPTYKINDTPFTANQLAAINSGITSELVQKILAGEANIASLQTAINNLETNKFNKADIDTAEPTSSSPDTKVTSAARLWKMIGAALSTLKTTAKTIVGAINELFDGKLNNAHNTDGNAHSALFNSKLNTSARGAVNGVASLDSSGKVPTSQLPDIDSEGEITEAPINSRQYIRKNSSWSEIRDIVSGVFVSVGSGGNITYSTDGINWTQITVGTASWYGITYGNGLFVAVGDDGYITYSSDGINWTLIRVVNTTNWWQGVTYGNGLFVAVGDDGYITYSSDGINWTQIKVGNTLRYGITYGNGLFIAVDIGGYIIYSTNGINWTQITVSTTAWYGITYGNGLFVAVGDGGNIAYSSDGINWTKITVVNITWQGVTYGNGLFVAVSQSGYVIYSTNGINWTTNSIITVGTVARYSITYANGLFVAVGNAGNITYSSDGIKWTQITVGTVLRYGITHSASVLERIAAIEAILRNS